jgi:Di-haem oxidoreductase, putative peroxidase
MNVLRHRRGGGWQAVLIAAALCAIFLPIRRAAADDAAPWAEKAITQHIDFTKLEGTLTAAKLQQLIGEGLHLFTAHFTTADGIGRPMATQAIIPTERKQPTDAPFRRTAGPDSNNCRSCHNVPVTGAAGDFSANAFVSEGFESFDFDTLDPQFSNERGSPSLFGAGLIELLGREMTSDLRAERDQAVAAARKNGTPQTVALTTKGVDFGKLTVMPDGLVDFSGLDGVDSDLTIRPFSQKGVFASLRQFTINAMNAHLGIEASERFGKRWTGTDDFDHDGHPDELSPGDVSAVVAYQASLPSPVQKVPDDPAWQAAATQGEKVFNSLGCAACHRPYLPLDSLTFTDPAPYDTAGTLRIGEVANPAVYNLALLDWTKTLPRNDKGQILVPLYGDLKRHRIADSEVNQLGNELLAQRFVERDVFMTAELWGVGSTAPYGHRNDFTTLDGVIRAHGGEARQARDAYIAAEEADRSDLIAFLKTLVIQQ